MKIPSITKKQQDILKLLYAYRYLDRKQIQLSLNHTDKRRVISWLKDLREKKYVEWIYSTDFVEKTKPAIYYLGINGIRYLKTLDRYPIEELRKRYRDTGRSRTFIDRSLLVADCCLSLRAINTNGTSQASFNYIPETSYIDPDHDYHWLAEHEVLRPNLCIVKRNKQGTITANYLLEIFDSSLPRYRMRYRLKKYVTYLEDGEWEGDDPAPIILLACPTITELIYAKRSTKKLIEDTYEDDLHIRFTTTELLRGEGIAAKIWEEGRLKHGL
jgi:hypothetical protein